MANFVILSQPGGSEIIATNLSQKPVPDFEFSMPMCSIIGYRIIIEFFKLMTY